MIQEYLKPKQMKNGEKGPSNNTSLHYSPHRAVIKPNRKSQNYSKVESIGSHSSHDLVAQPVTSPQQQKTKQCLDASNDHIHTIRKATTNRRPTDYHRHVGFRLFRKDHRLATCAIYLSHNNHKKYEAVINCVNCLTSSHKAEGCTSRNPYSTCNGKHYSSLKGHPRLFPTNELKERSQS